MLDEGHAGKHAVELPRVLGERETAVEHVQNARQMLENLKRDITESRANNMGATVPFEGWLDQVAAADKRLLKGLVQIKQATDVVDRVRRALTP